MMTNWERGDDDITATPEFQAWFGDSKVVDTEGRPLVVYHGTNRDFSSFAKSGPFGAARPRTRGGLASGARQLFCFSNDADVASEFAGRKPMRRVRAGPNVIPAFVALTNPLIIEAAGRPWSATQKAVLDAFDGGVYDGAIVRDSADGVMREGPASDVYIAFRPEQIKSAIGNRGSFDPANPNILFSQPAAPDENDIGLNDQPAPRRSRGMGW